MQEMIAAPAHGIGHPFLSAAGVPAARALMAAAAPATVPRRDVIFAPEAEPEALYLVLEGSFGLSMQGASASRGLLESIGGGECFLLPAVIMGGAWPFGAEALAPSRLLRIPVHASHATMAKEPRLARRPTSRKWRGNGRSWRINCSTRNSPRRANAWRISSLGGCCQAGALPCWNPLRQLLRDSA
ncbi:MAG: cyclic nucleotide-binding domain-containing protein [Alphaproteobacteria bacterium]|nr:cyclic nucleotide-binding domain-containing protein [Alphaproteobacteria bacterium]